MLQIEFTHPLTALIGPNGTNKTSILRAIEGSTDYVGLGATMFSTDLDQIENDRQQVVHGYMSAGYGRIVEAIKSRIRARGAKSAGRAFDPDYFEPSRPIISAGMSPMPSHSDYPEDSPDRTRTRWKAIDKKVLYLDFRTEISAFDKYFHHGPSENDRSNQQRKDRIRKWSRRLAAAFDSRLSSDVYFGSERIWEGPFEATPAELAVISSILGRVYSQITFIRHNYFKPSGLDSPGWTVRMVSGNLRYSEAFAGSGEFAITMMVRQILQAAPSTLILLDEPEVSLHPRAQNALLAFLRDQIKKKKHQVIFATHSPEMVRTLPASAIKVLDINPATGKVFLTAQATEPRDAFVRLGIEADDVLSIYVEDQLAKKLVERAIRPLTAEAKQRLRILPMGGASNILVHFVPMMAKSGQNRTLVLLDGDQNRGAIPLPETIATSEYSTRLRTLCDGDPMLLVDGGDDPRVRAKKVEAEQILLRWMHHNVRYLPGFDCPEVLLAEIAGLEPTYSSDTDRGVRAKEAKLFWRTRTSDMLDLESGVHPRAYQIEANQEQVLATVGTSHLTLSSIRDVVRSFLDNPGRANVNTESKGR
ncbi:AAA family ATPase [Rhodococcus fascians]|nr:AAA family ATPase [Rhodococcus fascians]MBY4021555.1 AAA family ATPase [Rhodococcus fascians]